MEHRRGEDDLTEHVEEIQCDFVEMDPTSPRGTSLAKAESLEAPVSYTRYDSQSALVDDEETKEGDNPHPTVHLRGVVNSSPSRDPVGCLKTRVGRALLITSILGIIGLVAALLVVFGGKNNVSPSSQSTENQDIGNGGTSSSSSSTIAPSIVPTTTSPLTIASTPSPVLTSQIPLSSASSPVTTSSTPPPTTTSTPPTTTSTVPPTTEAPTTQPTPTFGRIRDGTNSSAETINPESFPSRGCKLPNYISHDGKIFVQTPNGVETPIAIKGINWFGMDTEQNIPFGLWANPQNGTSIAEIVAFLARHKFNSIRLPLTVDSILRNTPPNENLVNTFLSPSLNLTTYLDAVSSIATAFGSKGISILLDLHYLSPTDTGDAWFSAQHPESNSLDAIDALASHFCNDNHWNVLGIDLKNEPWNTTWGDNGPKDMRVGAAKLGNRMLEKCPQWLAFVEGNARSHTVQINGRSFDYYDWWGGGLQLAGTYPLTLQVQSKIVWAPHYYSPSVYPQYFLVRSAKARAPGSPLLPGYVEWSDEELLNVVQTTAQDMFGYLRNVQGGAIVFGEFGGLYSLDAHPQKTSQRVIQDCMKIMKQPGYAGGYMWSLNPESGYGYNPSDTSGYWQEGLLQSDWVTANTEYLKALEILDDMTNLQPFPCYVP
ncbi:hypothetical protein LEN26_014303 [Aphanomyces euteiches]|nr:hypothetical protein LEN26_014303 [Aphanomyces euteiches]